MILIICATPLHIRIAERIIEKDPKEEYFILTYLNTYNSKTLYYHEQLIKRCRGGIVVIKSDKEGTINAYLNILKLLSIGLRIPKCKTVYLTNTNVPDIHLMLIRQRKAEIITFDDGTRNIIDDIPEDFFYFKLLQLYLYKYNLIPSNQYLKNQHSKHYSIYKYPNNMGPSEYLPLFTTDTESEGKKFNEEELILLGQPIYELEIQSKIKNTTLTEQVIKDYHINKYFPHPRENYHISDVEYIDTPLIIEDYLIQELKEHPERKYIIYSYCSTAVLNLQGVSKQIEFVLLKPQDAPEFLQGVYTLFEKLGLQITQLPYGANNLISQ